MRLRDVVDEVLVAVGLVVVVALGFIACLVAADWVGGV